MFVSVTDKCVICRQCECVAPNVFIIPENGLKAEVLDASPPAEERPAIIEAIRGCPVHCIRLRKAAPEAAGEECASGGK